MNEFDQKAAQWDAKPIRVERALAVHRGMVACCPDRLVRKHLLLGLQLLEADDLGPAAGGLADACQGLFEVLATVGAAGVLYEPHAELTARRLGHIPIVPQAPRGPGRVPGRSGTEVPFPGRGRALTLGA